MAREEEQAKRVLRTGLTLQKKEDAPNKRPKAEHTVCLVTEDTLTITPSSRSIMHFLCDKDASFDIDTNTWTFSVEEYAALLACIRSTHAVSGPPASLITCLAEESRRKKHPPRDKEGGKENGSTDKDRETPRSIWDRKNSVHVGLFQHQIEGVRRICSTGYKLLVADDMGLGKTIQSLAAVQHLLATERVEQSALLVIAPTSLVEQWKREVSRYITDRIFTVKDVPCMEGRGGSVCAVIDTYEMVRKYVGERRAAKKNAHPFFMVIVDESHSLKNISSARASVLVPFLVQAPRVVLLSGTPALSRPIEMYTQISIVSPSLYTQAEFCKRYCEIDPSKLKHVKPAVRQAMKYNGSKNLKELSIALGVFVMIRREKKDCPDLFGKQRYKINFVSPVHPAGKEKEERVFVVTPKPSTELLQQYHEASLEKIESVLAYIKKIRQSTEKKIIVFALHKDILSRIYESMCPHAIKIDGDVPKAKRDELCEAFKTSSDIRTAVLSIATCSTGLNLTCASIVIFAELYWNPGQLLQAEDRVYRIGQTSRVQIYYLIANSVDKAIWQHIQKKICTLKEIGLSNTSSLNFAEYSVDPKQGMLTLF
ncbi:SWI/SNF-related matrix-associated actin-dependent regulator of chromatin subfamily A-like protein 1 [Nematocida sp. AWRm77]|nr:SWI/SNF-related matrix-associated actin-dependent regulator of chromatin subfamily A-like protein 1 [Nematocida sp. AWRm77]